MPTGPNKRRIWPTILEVGIAFLIVYFLLGGRAWAPWGWALFSLFAVGVVAMNLLYSPESETYEKWQVGLAFFLSSVVVGGGLAAFVWDGTWWLLILGLVCFVIWINDYRFYRKIWDDRRRRQL